MFRQSRPLRALPLLAGLFMGLSPALAQKPLTCEHAFNQAPIDRKAAFNLSLFGLARNWNLASDWSQRDEESGQPESAIWGIRSYELETAPKDYQVGVLFDLNDADEGGEIEVAPLLELKNYPSADAVGETFTHGNQHFRFSNIGSRQMHLTTQAVDEMIAIHYKDSLEKKQVFVGLPEPWLQYHAKMSQLQSSTSLMTMLNYKARKPYLVREDLQNLNMRDTFFPSRSEYLVITKETGRAPFEMQYDDYKTSVLAAMRIARAGSGISIDDIDTLHHRSPGYLPCLERLSGAPKRLLKKFFAAAEMKGLRVAELTRFSKFQDLPAEAVKTLILRSFEFAHHPTDPIDLFVMEVDPITRRLFSQYGLEELVQFPTEENESPEYLMMIDTRTEKFNEVLRTLRKETQAFRSTVVKPRQASASDVRPMLAADTFKEDPLMSYNDSKKSMFRKGMEKVRSQSKSKLLQSHSQRIVSRAQVRDLVKRVLSLDIERIARAELDLLSQEDRRALLRKVALFSDDFENVVSGLNQFASIDGEIVLVGEDLRVYGDALKSISSSRKIRVLAELSELAGLASGSLDAVIISKVFSKTAQWERVLGSTRRVLKRNRVLLTLDPVPSRSWSTSMPKTSTELRKQLTEFAESALKNGAVMSEEELRLTLLTALEFFRDCQKSKLKRRQVVDFAEAHGFADHFNYGFQLSWFMGGELNWMHKE
ncbi:MAG: hypothetical protein EOP06_04930 [Proteobacteria bacterium]|nr:MAG: hypothetical protein EOP06_04930 [Pseudomonadota bacterium]